MNRGVRETRRQGYHQLKTLVVPIGTVPSDEEVRSGLYPSFRAPPTAVHCPEALLNFNGTSAKHMTVDMYFNSAHGKDGIPRLYMCTPQFELL